MNFTNTLRGRRGLKSGRPFHGRGSVGRQATVTVAAPFNGHPFKFRLTRETVDLGPAEVVDYFAFDGSSIRERGGGVNGAGVVDSWWAAMHAYGVEPDDDDRRHLLLAQAHRRLAGRRSLQGVYRSAYLSPGADRDYSLGDEETGRLRRLLALEGPVGLQRELEGLLMGDLPPEEELPMYTEALEELLGPALDAWRYGVEEGLSMWLGQLSSKVRNWQRRGTPNTGATAPATGCGGW